MMEKIVIIGATSAIAMALTDELVDNSEAHIYAIARKAPTHGEGSEQVTWFETDHSPDQIKETLALIKQAEGHITRVFICTGMLHGKNENGEQISPEKKIEQFSEFQFNQIMQVNVLIPTLWIQHLIEVCKQTEPCVITVFSARVGSISDNRLGGWYCYRMSKAALNMMIKTAAIEYARRAKNVKLLAFHPGTTDTPLSKPFQANVPAGKLFTPQFVAQQLMKITDSIEFDNQAQFIDWQNQTVSW